MVVAEATRVPEFSGLSRGEFAKNAFRVPTVGTDCAFTDIEGTDDGTNDHSEGLRPLDSPTRSRGPASRTPLAWARSRGRLCQTESLNRFKKILIRLLWARRRFNRMNWTHSGAVVRTLGFVWVVAAILVATGASPEVWLACGLVGTLLGLGGALDSGG